MGVLRFLKWFDVDVQDFQIEFWCSRFFGFFWSMFGLLYKKKLSCRFFKSSEAVFLVMCDPSMNEL